MMTITKELNDIRKLIFNDVNFNDAHQKLSVLKKQGPYMDYEMTVIQELLATRALKKKNI